MIAGINTFLKMFTTCWFRLSHVLYLVIKTVSYYAFGVDYSVLAYMI